MKCPVCATTDLLMTDRQGIEIDYCPQCRGVWLDRGELDKLIERSAISSPQPQPLDVPQRPREPEYRPSHKKEYENYGHHKKKSLLSELFDF